MILVLAMARRSVFRHHPFQFAYVVGVVLLPLGNGVHDVFGSIASIVGTNTTVVGIVSISVAEWEFKVDGKCFIRDVSLFLVTLFLLLLVLDAGKILCYHYF